MASIEIRRASVADLELATVAVASVHERIPCDQQSLREFLGDPSCMLFIALSEGKVVGSLNGYSLRHPERARPQFLLYEVDVFASHYRQGIGTALVDAFVAAARAANAFEVWVLTNTSNTAAMALYNSCGFTRENGDDAMFVLEM